jgi:hypothetical protein
MLQRSMQDLLMHSSARLTYGAAAIRAFELRMFGCVQVVGRAISRGAYFRRLGRLPAAIDCSEGCRCVVWLELSGLARYFYCLQDCSFSVLPRTVLGLSRSFPCTGPDHQSAAAAKLQQQARDSL